MKNKKEIFISIIALVLVVVLAVFIYHQKTASTQWQKNLDSVSNNDLATSTTQKWGPAQDLIYNNQNLLRESRTYFDNEIKKLHDTSKDMQFLWHPDQEKLPYVITQKPWKYGDDIKISDTQINIGEYTLKITYLEDITLDDMAFYTHIKVLKNNKIVETKDFEHFALNHIYKIKTATTEYYLLGLCHGGMHGCGVLVPMVYDSGKLVIGKAIEDVDFSWYLDRNNFFTKNGELYTIFDDSRYFFGYSTSNNASYNSAIPRIFRFDKTTANPVLAMGDFRDLYKKSSQIIGDDLNKLKNNLPEKTRVATMSNLDGWSLIPYFDYYLGMSIISAKSGYPEIRKEIEKLYTDLYGNTSTPEAHFDGYKDFEI